MTTQTADQKTWFLIDRAGFRGHCVSTVYDGDKVQFSGSLYNGKGRDLTVDEYPAHPQAGAHLKEPAVVDEDEMADLVIKWEKETYLDRPPVQITREDYYDALEVLPPLQWEHDEGVERFLMREFTTGSITTQFAKYNGRYICQSVDVLDPETFLTAADFAKATGGDHAD